MNKSFALKNKLYLFFLLVFSFFIFIYLVYFLINGQRGIISYFKIKNQNLEYKIFLSNLKIKNELLISDTKKLQTDDLDLDFLDQKIREKTGLINSDELIIKF